MIVSRNELGVTDAIFAAFLEIAFRFNRGEELLRVIDQFSREPYALRIARHGEQTLARSGVVEPLNCRSQPVLRDADANLPGGNLFDCVRFIQNEKIIRKNETAFAFLPALPGCRKE